jgi:hypothetical protein
VGREVRRVPVDFNWPLEKVWDGYLMPASLRENPCPACERGYSPDGEALFKLWYGYVPFDPASTGAERLTADTPAVRAFAERNVSSAPSYHGVGERAVVVEAERLADLWNGQWCHHLAQEDVDALVDAGRLMDFTHTFDRVNRWQPKDPPYRPAAAEVNEWSLRGLGHDAINAGVVISARCEREGKPVVCATCAGRGNVEAYPGQRAEADAWESVEPPEGDGWQVWETVSEGSPITPVFASANELVDHLATTGTTWDVKRGDGPWRRSAAEAFVSAGWAPSGASVGGGPFLEEGRDADLMAVGGVGGEAS